MGSESRYLIVVRVEMLTCKLQASVHVPELSETSRLIVDGSFYGC